MPKNEPYHVGMIFPPGAFDTRSPELVKISGEKIMVMQTQLRLGPDFNYRIEQFPQTAGEVEACAKSLAETGADLVGQYGVPFSTIHGWKGGLALSQRIERNIGTPFEMMGLCVPRAVQALQCETVTAATVYYDHAWTEMYSRFLTESGLRVLAAESFVSQGVLDESEVAERYYTGFELEHIERAVIVACERAPNADCVVISGMPRPMVHEIEHLEGLVGRPVVGYFAIFWRIMDRLGIGVSGPSGKLLNTLAS